MSDNKSKKVFVGVVKVIDCVLDENMNYVPVEERLISIGETCGNVCVRTANRRIFGLDGIDDFMTWRCFRHTYGHTVTMTGAALAYLSKPYYRR